MVSSVLSDCEFVQMYRIYSLSFTYYLYFGKQTTSDNEFSKFKEKICDHVSTSWYPNCKPTYFWVGFVLKSKKDVHSERTEGKEQRQRSLFELRKFCRKFGLKKFIPI